MQIRRQFFQITTALIVSTSFARAQDFPDWFTRGVTCLDPELNQWQQNIVEHEGKLKILARIPKELTGERLGYHSRITQQNTEPWVLVDLGRMQRMDTIIVVPIVLPHEQGGIEGYGFPHRYRVEMSDDGTTFDPRRMIDFTTGDQLSPRRHPIVIPCNSSARYVRFTATKPAGSPPKNGGLWPSLALAEIMVLRGDRNLAAGCQVTAPTSREAPPVWSVQNLTDSESILGAPVAGLVVPRVGYHSLTQEQADTPIALTFDLGQTRALEDVRLFPMQWTGYPHWLGFGFPVRFRVECSDDSFFNNPQVLGDQTSADFPNPGMNPVVVPANNVSARFVRVTATRLWERFTDHIFALSEVQIFSAGRNLAPTAKLDTPESYPAKEWKREFLVDGNASDNPILPLPQWIAELQHSAQLENELAGLIQQRLQRLQSWWHRSMQAVAALVVGAFAIVLMFAWRSIQLRKSELASLRERIARDLHDEVGSNLAGIALLSREAAKMASPERDALLDDIRRIAEETTGSMRDLVWMIQPSAPGDLVGAFRQCAERMLSGKVINFEPAQHPLPAKLSIDFKRQFYLIYREALQNVVKHSQAKCVTISMQREGAWLQLSVRDDGCGFEMQGDHFSQRGFGLENMQQRARKLGGECTVTSKSGEGTEVRIRARC